MTIEKGSPSWEHSAWVSLLVTVIVVPLAVLKLPGSAALPYTITVFGLGQSAVLFLGVSIALALWAMALLTSQTEIAFATPMLALAAVLGWACISTAAGLEPLRSLFGASTSALSLGHFSAYCIMAFLVIQLVGSLERLLLLTWGLVGSGTLVSIIALMQQFLDFDIFRLPVEGWRLERGFSTIGNPVQLGTFLVTPLVLGAMLAASEKPGRRGIALGCFGLIGTAVVGTLTRGAWLGALAGALVVGVVLWKATSARVTRASILLLVGVALAALLVGLAGSDLATRFAPSQDQAALAQTATARLNVASSGRLGMWRAALIGASERPLTGTGPAAFELAWYPNAVDETSVGGVSSFADDPHSLGLFVLATTGIPGFLAFAWLALASLVIGAQNTTSLARSSTISHKGLLYAAWFAAVCAGQVALLVAAVSTPVVMCVFVGFAVLLRPVASKIPGSAALRRSIGLTAGFAAALLVTLVWPNIAAEVGTAGIYRGESPDNVRRAVALAPWNMDVQRAYYGWRSARLKDMTGTGSIQDRATRELADELNRTGGEYSHDFYFPALRSQILTQLSERTGSESDALAAISSSDDALAIMPASIPVRVNRALALSDLGRYAEMAETLEAYWRNELYSAYPGILYAQALALSGDVQASESIFDELESRFPDDPAVGDARIQTLRLLEQEP